MKKATLAKYKHIPRLPHWLDPRRLDLERLEDKET